MSPALDDLAYCDKSQDNVVQELGGCQHKWGHDDNNSKRYVRCARLLSNHLIYSTTSTNCK
jgi:hypothetical protein